jgi:hypothetical protein
VFGLPNIKSAKKRVLVNKTKAAQNKAAKSALKTDIKKFEAAVVEGNRSEAEGGRQGGRQGCGQGSAAQEQRRSQEERHDH